MQLAPDENIYQKTAKNDYIYKLHTSVSSKVNY